MSANMPFKNSSTQNASPISFWQIPWIVTKIITGKWCRTSLPMTLQEISWNIAKWYPKHLFGNLFAFKRWCNGEKCAVFTSGDAHFIRCLKKPNLVIGHWDCLPQKRGIGSQSKTVKTQDARFCIKTWKLLWKTVF